MRHWLQIGTRNWRAKPGRTAAAVAAIALGVGVVVWVTCAYESVRGALKDQAWFWIGKSHLSVESVYGPEGTVYQSIADEIRNFENIEAITVRLKHRLIFNRIDPNEAELPTSGTPVQAVGIDPNTEYDFRDFAKDRVQGRLLQPDDGNAAVVEQRFAKAQDLEIGDRFVLRRRMDDASPGSEIRHLEFTIVGFVEHQRVARQQLPMVMVRFERVQELSGYSAEPARVTKIDIRLKDSERKAFYKSERKIRIAVSRHRQSFLVSASKNKERQIAAAEQQSGFVLLLISSVALFTGFFVILSTLSMSVLERAAQLGTLRCVGTTRFQMAGIVLAEAVPIGVVGLLAGVPVGLLLTRLTVWLVPEYVGEIALSRGGLWLALGGGAFTTLAGTLLPMLQAMYVSPLSASRPHARPAPVILSILAVVIGLGMVISHWLHLTNLPLRDWFIHPSHGVLSVMLLYCGYALMMPVVILLIGRLAIQGVATLVGIHRRLLQDQVGRATWRSSVICSGLMVGLSLIVSIVVQAESIASGWDFPKQFCEAFVFVSPPIPREQAQASCAIEGVAERCLINVSTQCSITGKALMSFPTSRFLAGDPREFFSIAELEFVKGSQEEALEKLERGGYILVTPQFVEAMNVDYGEKVRIRTGLFGRSTMFEIAAVITSPALDIAANYFNAGGMLVRASVLAVIGTSKDLKTRFNVSDEVSMYLLNFDLPRTSPPSEFEREDPPSTQSPRGLAEAVVTWRTVLPERKAQLDGIQSKLDTPQPMTWWNVPYLSTFRGALTLDLAGLWDELSAEQRWKMYREELVLQLIARNSRPEYSQHASVRALKEQIDTDLQKATMIVAAIPTVALIVAALGVANLMIANVASRARQLAILRALGATKWQVTRMIIGEALVLGVLGSVIGVALGYHGAKGMSYLMKAIYGFEAPTTIPWDWVGLGVAFTVGICLIAGIIPARRAARTDIIESLQTT